MFNKEILNQVQNDRKAVVEFEGQSVETLTRISNFRRAQIEILPSAKGTQSHKTRKLVCSASVTRERGFTRKVLRKDAAFTLAETLITIGIIGVVAALTIPNLVHNYRETVVANKLKKTYLELQQAVKLSEGENGDITGWDYTLDGATFSETYIMPYLAKSHSANKGRYNCNLLNGTSTFCTSVKYYYLDKMIAIQPRVEQYGTDIKYAYIFVDLNGDSGPNLMGNDVFMFTLFNYKYGGGSTNCPRGEHYGLYLGNLGGLSGAYCSTLESILKGECSAGSTGYNCGLAIQKNGWKVPKSYPVKL
jgi:type II secretory pathway pseudopilin PulG